MGNVKKDITKQGVDPIGTVHESGKREDGGGEVSGEKSEASRQQESGGGESQKTDDGDQKASNQEASNQEEVNETPEEAKLRIKRANDAEAKRIKRAALKENGGVVKAHIEAVPNTPSSKAKKDNAKAPKASSVTADFLAKQVYGMHQLMVLFIGQEAGISQADANMLGEAAFEVIKEYDLAWIGKFGKWGGLLTAVAIVEVPVVMRLRAKQAQTNLTPMTHTVESFQTTGQTIPGIASGTPS